MIQLTGETLSIRHQELNKKVNEAATNNVSFEEVKAGTTNSDVDILFKIDLAAKYKNIDYIEEVLKSGDSLYISRALKKCPWLFNDEHTKVINTDYLHHNIFPFMSIKMKKKLLTTVSLNVRNENRAADFYKYCIHTKLNGTADKFLNFTSDEFKLNLIQNDIIDMEINKLKSFIGNSFALLEAYLDKQTECKRDEVIRAFTHLYLIASVKYLDLLEKYIKLKKSNKLSLKISKFIMTKNKERVLENPCFYVKVLSMNQIIRHSSAEDAKVYIASLMPKQQQDFWNENICETYMPIIELLSEDERYGYIKKLFLDHYPDGEFESTNLFYDQKCYNLMTYNERENWAIRQIESGHEILGSGRNYIWYKFVNFEKAFVEIKKYIRVATNPSKRNGIVNILVFSAKTQRELETLFKYFYDRHVNEVIGFKYGFLNRVLSQHNVFDFDEGCWAAFSKILSSIEVYNVLGHIDNAEYKIVAIIYHILHSKEIPDALTQYMDSKISMYSMKAHIEKLNIEKKEVIYDFMFNYYLQKIKNFNALSNDMLCTDKIKSEVNTYIHFLLGLMSMFKKNKHDVPEVVMRFVRLDEDTFKYEQILAEEDSKALTESRLLKNLKEDAKQVIDNLEMIEEKIRDDSYFKMNRLLKKVKVYFADDIAKEFLKLFHKILSEKSRSSYRSKEYMAVYGIFQLGDEKTKVDFMNKYVPENDKIDHTYIDAAVLNIQEAICRFACYSRPPVPLSNILKYLKGDYVRFCLPMFKMYLANLPLPLCLKFVQSIIDAPVSVQKHGLRLAFKCFPKENLTELIMNTWKNTKYVSLRSVIYKAFFDKTVEEDDRQLFKVLKTLTFDLHEDDDDALFCNLTSYKISNDFLAEYLEAAWNTVDKFTNKEMNIQRRTSVLKKIDSNINVFKKDTVKVIVDEVYKRVTIDKKDYSKNYEESELNKAMWKLIASYIVHFTICEQDRLENVTFTKVIIKHFLEKWDEEAREIYIFRKNFLNFIDNLQYCSFDTKDYSSAIPIFELVLEEIQKALPLHKVYLIVWELRLTILQRRLIAEGRKNIELDKFTVIVNTAVNFGRAIGDIIKDFLQNNSYYSHFLNNIVGFINDGARNILLYVSHEPNNPFLTQERMLVEISRGLIETDIVETYHLALQLLPDEPEGDIDVYKSVLNKIRDFPDMEIQTYVYEKFYGDCKRRRIV